MIRRLLYIAPALVWVFFGAVRYYSDTFLGVEDYFPWLQLAFEGVAFAGWGVFIWLKGQKMNAHPMMKYVDLLMICLFAYSFIYLISIIYAFKSFEIAIAALSGLAAVHLGIKLLANRSLGKVLPSNKSILTKILFGISALVFVVAMAAIHLQDLWLATEGLIAWSLPDLALLLSPKGFATLAILHPIMIFTLLRMSHAHLGVQFHTLSLGAEAFHGRDPETLTPNERLIQEAGGFTPRPISLDEVTQWVEKRNTLRPYYFFQKGKEEIPLWKVRVAVDKLLSHFQRTYPLKLGDRASYACDVCHARANRIFVDEIQVPVCNQCGKTDTLRKPVELIIATIGTTENPRPDSYLMKPVQKEAGKGAVFIEADELWVMNGENIDYDWAISSFIENWPNHVPDWKKLTIRLINGPKLSYNTLKILENGAPKLIVIDEKS